MSTKFKLYRPVTSSGKSIKEFDSMSENERMILTLKNIAHNLGREMNSSFEAGDMEHNVIIAKWFDWVSSKIDKLTEDDIKDIGDSK